jgi:hypothetical protein
MHNKKVAFSVQQVKKFSENVSCNVVLTPPTWTLYIPKSVVFESFDKP